MMKRKTVSAIFVLVVLYLVMGAAVFKSLEQPHERWATCVATETCSSLVFSAVTYVKTSHFSTVLKMKLTIFNGGAPLIKLHTYVSLNIK